MLVAMAPIALMTPADKRHPHMETVIKILTEVLDVEEERLKGVITTAQNNNDGCSVEKENRIAEAERVEAKLQAKSAEVQELQSLSAMVAAVAEDSKAELEDAKRAQDDAEAETEGLAAEKERIFLAKSASFDPLVSGTVDN